MLRVPSFFFFLKERVPSFTALVTVSRDCAELRPTRGQDAEDFFSPSSSVAGRINGGFGAGQTASLIECKSIFFRAVCDEMIQPRTAATFFSSISQEHVRGTHHACIRLRRSKKKKGLVRTNKHNQTRTLWKRKKKTTHNQPCTVS